MNLSWNPPFALPEGKAGAGGWFRLSAVRDSVRPVFTDTPPKVNIVKVSQAIATRKAIRAFRPDPVPLETMKQILALAARAPSGGNLQPWKVYVLVGPARDELVRRVAEARKEKPLGE